MRSSGDRYRRTSDTLRLVFFACYLPGDHTWGRMKREGFGGGPPAGTPEPSPAPPA